MNNAVLLDLLLKSKYPKTYKRLFDEYMDNRDGWSLSEFETMWRKSALNKTVSFSSDEFSNICDYWYTKFFIPLHHPEDKQDD